MALNQNPNPFRQDGSNLVAGDQGDLMNQEPGSGKQVYRRGAAEGQADIDVGTASSPVDIIADGDFESGSRNAGGAEALAGELVSDDNNTFSVEIDWLNDDNDVVITHTPPALTNVTSVDFNLIMRSDRFEVRITDTSAAAQNNVHGTLNSH